MYVYINNVWSNCNGFTSTQGEDGGPAATFASGGGFEFGVDPNEDPELALVSIIICVFFHNLHLLYLLMHTGLLNYVCKQELSRYRYTPANYSDIENIY